MDPSRVPRIDMRRLRLDRFRPSLRIGARRFPLSAEPLRIRRNLPLLSFVEGLAGIALVATVVLPTSIARPHRSDADAYARARELRALGTIEGRREAIEILDALHRGDPRDLRIAKELARTYVEARFPAYAVETLERTLERRAESGDVDDAEARVEAARLLIRRTIQHHDSLDLPRAVGHLEAALEACSGSIAPPSPRAPAPLDSSLGRDAENGAPGRRGILPALWPACRLALLLRSTAHVLARPAARDPLAVSEAGARLTERILSSEPRDPDALLVHGIHLHDLGDLDGADEAFRSAIDLLPKEAGAFLIPPALLDSSLIRAGVSAREDRIRAYWEERDPTPLTVRNELLLTYWYRAAMADIYFSDPEDGTRGWSTQPGKAMMLLGSPLQRDETQSFWHADASVMLDPGRSASNPTGPATIRFEPERLTLAFPGGVSFGFRKRHPDEPWIAERATSAALRRVTGSGNPRLTYTGRVEIDRIHAITAGFRDPQGGSREACFAAIPPWIDREDWWRDAVIDIRLLDARRRLIGQEQRIVSEADVFPAGREASVLLVGRDFQGVAPGRYTLAIDVTQDGGSRMGTRREVIEVPDLRSGDGRLRMSQIEFLRTGSARWNDVVFPRPERPYLPDPVAALGPGDEVEAYYEVYDLVPRDRELCYRVTQTIVPVAYRRAWEQLDETGRAQRSDSLAYGREGDRLGGVVLNESNRRTVSFPPTRVPAGAASDGTVRATARINAAGLRPGGYAFRIEIEDCADGRRAMAETYFRVVAGDEMDRMLRAPSPKRGATR